MVIYNCKTFCNIVLRSRCQKTFFVFIAVVLSGLYYKCVMIVIDAPSVVKVTLQIVASLMIVIDDAN